MTHHYVLIKIKSLSSLAGKKSLSSLAGNASGSYILRKTGVVNETGTKPMLKNGSRSLY